MKSWKKGTRVKVKSGWYEYGKSGTVLGKNILVGNVWTPILWDDADDPDWSKTTALEKKEE